jgi:hypothetical protein
MCRFCSTITRNSLQSPSIAKSKSPPCYENTAGTRFSNTRWIFLEKVFPPDPLFKLFGSTPPGRAKGEEGLDGGVGSCASASDSVFSVKRRRGLSCRAIHALSAAFRLSASSRFALRRSHKEFWKGESRGETSSKRFPPLAAGGILNKWKAASIGGGDAGRFRFGVWYGESMSWRPGRSAPAWRRRRRTCRSV